MTANLFHFIIKSCKVIRLYIFNAQGNPHRSSNSNGGCTTDNKVLYTFRNVMIGLTVEVHYLNRQFSLIQHAYNAILPFYSGYHMLSLLLTYISFKQSLSICQSTKNMTK